MRVFVTNKLVLNENRHNMLARKSRFGCFRPSKPSVKKVVTTGNRKQMRFPKLRATIATSQIQERRVAKKSKTKVARRAYTKADVKELRAHSKARTPVAKLSKLTKRTEGSTSEGAKARY